MTALSVTVPSALLARVRADAPLVQCITNYVAMNIVANALLAIGASPGMVHAEEEAGEFAAVAGALTVNIGTLSPVWVSGMKAAVAGAKTAGKPWVLDPVAHFATGFRRKTVAELLALGPTVIRGNASEIITLAGEKGAGRGIDSGDPVERAEDAARRVAISQGAVVAVTGKTDFVTDGAQAARIVGGSDLMPRVTALGCSLTGAVGAFLAVAPDAPFAATVAALAAFAEAGETAASGAGGPGSFAVAFLDALYNLDGHALDARVEAQPASAPSSLSAPSLA